MTVPMTKKKKKSKQEQKPHPELAVAQGGVSKKKASKKSSKLLPATVQTEDQDVPEASVAPPHSIPNPQPGSEAPTQTSEPECSHHFVCPFCESGTRSFSTVKELSEHKKREHKEFVMNCCLCDFSSTVLRKWYKHLRKAHVENMGKLITVLDVGLQELQGDDGVDS